MGSEAKFRINQKDLSNITGHQPIVTTTTTTTASSNAIELLFEKSIEKAKQKEIIASSRDSDSKVCLWVEFSNQSLY